MDEWMTEWNFFHSALKCYMLNYDWLTCGWLTSLLVLPQTTRLCTSSAPPRARSTSWWPGPCPRRTRECNTSCIWIGFSGRVTADWPMILLLAFVCSQVEGLVGKDNLTGHRECKIGQTRIATNHVSYKCSPLKIRNRFFLFHSRHVFAFIAVILFYQV